MGVADKVRCAAKRAVVAASPKASMSLRHAIARAGRCSVSMDDGRIACVARDSSSGSDGRVGASIDLIGVYDIARGSRSFRFICSAPMVPMVESAAISAEPKSQVGELAGCDVALFDIFGRRMDAKLDMLSYPCVKGDAVSFVVSAEVTGDVKGLFVVACGIGFRYFDNAAIKRFESARDVMMCNPGIDGLYGKWIEDEQVRCVAREGAQGCQDARRGDERFAQQPLMSVVTPVYNTPIRYLRELLDSMLAQTYGNWEHVLVNASPDNAELSAFLDSLADERFKVVTLSENMGIPGNTLAGIEVTSGDYISFVDHDDTVSPHAFEAYVVAINEDPEADLLYCDEDTLSEDGVVRSHPMFKPDFNVDLLTSLNYVLHMLTVSRWAYERVEPYGNDVNGSQDYDLTLKVAAIARSVVHVTGALYHWREHEASLNGGSIGAKPYAVKTGALALNRFYESCAIDAHVCPSEVLWLFRTDYAPSVACDVSLVVRSSNAARTQSLIESLSSQRSEILAETIIVGDSSLGFDAGDLNKAIAEASGDFIILVDDGAEFTSACDALGRMRDALARPDLGIVSAKSITSEGLNLHAGLCVKPDGTIGYLNQGFIQGMGGGYNGCAECQCDYSAVDMSCAAFRKSDFMEVGGFSSEYQTELACAVDFSFKMRERGKLVMVDADSRVTSLACCSQLIMGASHLADESHDLEVLWSLWGDAYRKDVLDNPNYTLSNSYFNLKIEG